MDVGGGKITELFLLGAGASMDAGLPDSKGLLRSIKEAVPEKMRGLIESVITIFPKNSEHNIESFFDFFNKLIDGDIYPLLDEKHRANLDPEKAKELSEKYQQLVVDCLIATQKKAISNNLFDYLLPLIRYAQNNNVPIATLNYDNSIEILCNTNNVSYSECQLGVSPFRTDVNLLKLHGSLSWDGGENQPPSILKYPEVDVIKTSGKPKKILFAGRKATTEEPFFGLMVTFYQMFFNLENLYVIGYSFSDWHVNLFIERWISAIYGHFLMSLSGELEFEKRMVIISPDCDQKTQELIKRALRLEKLQFPEIHNLFFEKFFIFHQMTAKQFLDNNLLAER